MRIARLVVAAAVSILVFCVFAPVIGHAGATPPSNGSNSQPQPYSNADQNNTGANDTSSGNQYASTRNGSPSQNGNGNGNATGKPCAGCVGKADNKNPPGQYPNGSDANNGYECDGNQGIGQSNPAHTGCSATSSTTTEPSSGDTTTTTTTGPGSGDTTTTTTGPGSGDTTTTTTLSGGSGDQSSTSGFSGSSGSGSGSGSSGPSSQSGGGQSPSGSSGNSSPAPATKASGGRLPFTGANVGRYVLLGLASLLLGTILYLLDPRTRRRLTAAGPRQ